MIVYEYPFNERIRTLLRLESLFDKFSFFAQQIDPLQHHVALTTMFDIQEVAGRADLKSDLLQEMDRQKDMLLTFKSNPEVETQRLDQIIDELERAIAALQASPGRAGQNLKENDWLMSLRGRALIPGGCCEFDLPSYHAWQHQPSEQRLEDIARWFSPLTPLFDAVGLVLRLLRESGEPTRIVAEQGSFQQMLQGRNYQMLRMQIDASLGLIPEISANKYMLWVRFFRQSIESKGKSFDNDVPFDLVLCNF